MKTKKKIHFVGIGGIGMSAIARYFKGQKDHAVSGSDATKSKITKALAGEGIPIVIDHKRRNVPRGTELLITSQAIRPGNPECEEARRRGLRILTYPEAVAELTEQYKTIAIAGAHGKSTTTALAALTLIKGGLDPTVIVGTNLKEFGNGAGGGKNFRAGKSDYLVLEADEFGNAFLRYSPTIAIVTNIDREHLDVYKNLTNIKRAFIKFLSNTASGGAFILNRDDKNLHSLQKQIKVLSRTERVRLLWYSLQDPEAKKIKRIIQISGTHNVSNAIAVYKLGKLLNINEKKILSAVGSYRGAWRRMQYRGTFRGAPVFDDYAHHPTEIKATLRAFREKYPRRRIVCVFQPHQAKRLAALFKEFTAAFRDAHEVIILPAYKVAGRDGGPMRRDSRALTAGIQKREPQKPVFYLPDPRNLKRALADLPAPLSRKVIVMMGAGDVVNYTDRLLQSV